MNFKTFLKESKTSESETDLKWEKEDEKFVLRTEPNGIWYFKKTKEGLELQHFSSPHDENIGNEDNLKSAMFQTDDELISHCNSYQIPVPPIK